MLKIGITGNIGSGKTTVSKLFELLGIPVFYADDQAKQVMTADPILIAEIKTAFGHEAYFADGSLNRKYLAGIVFNHSTELQKLNAIVHPAVFRAFDNWVPQHPQATYVMKEAALLYESSSYQLCDYNIVVTAPLQQRLQRVIQRDHITPTEAESRDARQMPEDEKAKLADYLIKNDETELVITQVLRLHEQFTQLARTV